MGQKKNEVINGNPRAFANNFQSNCKINWNRYERDYKLKKKHSRGTKSSSKLNIPRVKYEMGID